MVDELVEVLSWVARLIPALLGLREALKTNDASQEYAANRELLRVMRMQIRAEKARETRDAILSDERLGLPAGPLPTDDPWK